MWGKSKFKKNNIKFFRKVVYRDFTMGPAKSYVVYYYYYFFLMKISPEFKNVIFEIMSEKLKMINSST